MSATLSAAQLEPVLFSAFTRRGVPAEAARQVTQALIRTSLRGVDTHGIRLAPIYLGLLEGGRVKATPALKCERRAGALSLIDADRALGHVAGFAAMAEAKRLASEQGIGLVLVRNSNHFGAAACFTLPLAEEGWLGFASTNADKLVVPWNGVEALFGTNPIAVAAPAQGQEVFSLDMATSQIAYSRVKHHRASGEALASGWAVNAAGQGTCDPAAAANLSPLGGYKGSGLALAVQVLTALLGGGTFDHELTHVFNGEATAPMDVSHLVGAIDIARFTELAAFRQRLSALLAVVRAMTPAGSDSILAPGDREARTEAERRVSGIPLEAGWLEAMTR